MKNHINHIYKTNIFHSPHKSGHTALDGTTIGSTNLSLPLSTLTAVQVWSPVNCDFWAQLEEVYDAIKRPKKSPAWTSTYPALDKQTQSLRNFVWVRPCEKWLRKIK